MQNRSTPITWPDWLCSRAEVGVFDPVRSSSSNVFITTQKLKKKKIIFLYDSNCVNFRIHVLAEQLKSPLLDLLHKDNFQTLSYTPSSGLHEITSLENIQPVGDDFSRKAMWKTICINGAAQKDFVAIGLNDSADDCIRLLKLITIGLSERIIFEELIIFINFILSKKLLYSIFSILTKEMKQSHISLLYILRLWNNLGEIGEHYERKLGVFLDERTVLPNLAFLEAYHIIVSYENYIGQEKCYEQIQQLKATGSWSDEKYLSALHELNLNPATASTLINSENMTQVIQGNASLFYAGTLLGHQVIPSSGSSALTQAPVLKYISPGTVPTWISALIRMSPGTIFELSAPSNILQEIHPKKIKIIQISNVMRSHQYQLEIFASQLISYQIDGYYLLPIHHPLLNLIQCDGGSIFEDQLGRWFLTTHDLNQCKVIVSIPRTLTDSNVCAHIITANNYQQHQAELEASQAWAVISHYFGVVEPESNKPLETYVASNKENISCNDRAQYLIKKLNTVQNISFVQNGTHAFLLIKNKNPNKNLFIDCGGATATITLQPMKEAVPTTINNYQKQLTQFSQLINTNLAELSGQQKVLKNFSVNERIRNGVFCIIGDPFDTLQSIQSWKFERNYDYFPDVTTFIQQAQLSIVSNSVYIINLDPWHTTDQSKREQLRLCLHEWLDNYKESVCYVLLTEHEYDLRQDASFSSRVSEFYNQPESIIIEAKQPSASGVITPVTGLNLGEILKQIDHQVSDGQLEVNIPVLYSEEDQAEWRNLEKIIQYINHTQYLFINGRYQKFHRPISVHLRQETINLSELFADVIDEGNHGQHIQSLTLILTPDLIQFGLDEYIESLPNQSVIELSIYQELNNQQWFNLLSAIKNKNCTVVFNTINSSSIPYTDAKSINIREEQKGSILVSNAPEKTTRHLLSLNEKSVSISVANLQGPDNFLSCGAGLKINVLRSLQAGEDVILYANKTLDEFGNLQQLLLPFLMGYALDAGRVCLLPGKLHLILSVTDAFSINYFSSLNCGNISENTLSSQQELVVGADIHTNLNAQHESESKLPEQFQFLPDLNRMPGDYLLPDSSASERKQTIFSLWKHFGTKNNNTDKIYGVLIEGPSALGKTSLIKKVFLHLNFQLIDSDVDNYLLSTNRKTCYFYKHAGKASLEKCLAHAEKYNHVIVIDEVNGLSGDEQDLLGNTLANQKDKKNRLFIIGTYNPPNYPGREVCTTLLKRQCIQYSFNPYSSEESTALFKLKLHLKHQLPAQIIEDLMKNIIITDTECDALLRVISNCFTSHSNEFFMLAVHWIEVIFEDSIKSFLTDYQEISEKHNLLSTHGYISKSSAQLINTIEAPDKNIEAKALIIANLLGRMEKRHFFRTESKSQIAINKNQNLYGMLKFFEAKAPKFRGLSPSEDQRYSFVLSTLQKQYIK